MYLEKKDMSKRLLYNINIIPIILILISNQQIFFRAYAWLSLHKSI